VASIGPASHPAAAIFERDVRVDEQGACPRASTCACARAGSTYSRGLGSGSAKSCAEGGRDSVGADAPRLASVEHRTRAGEDRPVKIDALFRYPVKSMLGEEVASTVVGERGLAGDRAYALVDQETGKAASAKNPRRWGVLFECRARFVDEPLDGAELPAVEITGPSGETIRSDDPHAHESLSRIVGRPVRIESRVPDGVVSEQYHPPVVGISDPRDGTTTDGPLGIVAPGTFFDAAPLHLLTTATLDHLAEHTPESTFSAARFRPNVVVAIDDATGFVENDWVGHGLNFGGASASVFLAAPRCVMTTLAQPGLAQDRAVLTTIARYNRFDIPGLGPSSCAGVYALVTRGGTARKGDPVEIT
jgi:uncharacterized protein